MGPGGEVARRHGGLWEPLAGGQVQCDGGKDGGNVRAAGLVAGGKTGKSGCLVFLERSLHKEPRMSLVHVNLLYNVPPN